MRELVDADRISLFMRELGRAAGDEAERGHERDLTDVRALIDRGLVEPVALRRVFDEIRPQLYRFPAVDERAFAAAVDALP